MRTKYNGKRVGPRNVLYEKCPIILREDRDWHEVTQDMLLTTCVPARDEGYRTYQIPEQYTLKKVSSGIETYLERGCRLPGKRRPMTQCRTQPSGSSKVDEEGSYI
jgi:hypothetical protein